MITSQCWGLRFWCFSEERALHSVWHHCARGALLLPPNLGVSGGTSSSRLSHELHPPPAFLKGSFFTPSLQSEVPGLCKKAHFPAECHTAHWNNYVIRGEVVGINYCDRQQEIDLTHVLIQYLFISKRDNFDSLLLPHIPISNIIHSSISSATAKDIQKSTLKNLFLIL